jgi:hypothetical protein
MTTYQSDMQRAWDRINSVAAGKLQIRFGTIQYAQKGEGLPLLVTACSAATSTGSTAGGRPFGGPASASSPPPASATSTPGCRLPPRRPIRPTPTPCCWTISAWSAVVTGFSAGSGSILEFGLRHPDRTVALILANCRLGGGVTNSNALRPLFRLAYRADGPFWLFKRLLPTAYSRMMGAPKGYRPTREDAQALTSIRELLFPLKPRCNGAVFDGFVSNLAADRFPLEQLKIPALVISAKDDPLAPHRFAVEAAARIPGARLVAIEGGGHLFLGHDAEVGKEVSGFVASILANRAGS